ncbi:hypothetical protein J6590_058506, partial [Homalodisca vitripennis]
MSLVSVHGYQHSPAPGLLDNDNSWFSVAINQLSCKLFVVGYPVWRILPQEDYSNDIPSNPEKPTMKKVMITEYNAADTSSSIVQPEIIQTTQRQPLQQTTVPPTVGRGRGKLLQKLA